MKNSKFCNAPFIRFAAAVGGEKVAAVEVTQKHKHHNSEELPEEDRDNKKKQSSNSKSTLGMLELYRSFQEAFQTEKERSGTTQQEGRRESRKRSQRHKRSQATANDVASY